MAWTDEMIDELKKLWDQGVTTGEIGKKLGVSKNSIVGKVHRLGLSGRPSPIKKKEDVSSHPQKAEKKETEVKISKEKSSSKAKDVKVEQTTTEAEKEKKQPAKTSFVPKKEEVHKPAQPVHHFKEGHASLTDLDNHTCRWPIGDPKDEDFHFCGRKVKIGQTYCEEHSNIAYVKTTKK